MKIEIKQPDEF